MTFCLFCGDKIVSTSLASHTITCWARDKMREKPIPMLCPRCGYEMTPSGLCVRWRCR